MKCILFNLDKVVVMVVVEISLTNTYNMGMESTYDIPYLWHFILKEGTTLIPMCNFYSLVLPITILVLGLRVGYHREG